MAVSLGTSLSRALNPNSSGTTLEDFLSKFSPSEGTYVNMLDPLHTFDITMEFSPTDPSNEATEKSYGKKVLDSLIQAGKDAANSAINNLTGGLVGSFMNDQTTIDGERTKYGKVNKNTFLEYLAKANLLIGGEGVFSSSPSTSLILQVGYYVQSVTVPNIKLEDGGVIETYFGKIPMIGKSMGPDNNTLIFQVLNTKNPLLERIFYPWMRETTLPFWSYQTQPYTTATITIDFSKHADIKYVFYGCRPIQIDAEQPTQEVDTTMTRGVTFAFDFMFVMSNDTTHESGLDKLISTASTLASGVSQMTSLSKYK